MGTYLSRTLSSPNVNKFTVSLWVKGISLSGDDYLFALADGGHHVHVRRDGSMQLQSQLYNGAVQIGQLISSAVYRDPASWYHVVYRQDIENSTANQRDRLYVNGEEITYGTQTNPSSTNAGAGMSFNIFKTTSYSGTGDNFTGYMTDLNYFDGYSYGPDSFGETDSTTGEWKPKVDFTGVTYGTNGFRCQFGNAAALGTDTSGNTNTLTVNNAGTGAQTVDTASNNFCTMNPLANRYPNSTFTLGNLAVAMGASQSTFNTGTFGVSSGKWYFEMKPTALGSGTDNCLVGIVSRSDSTGTSDYLGEPTSVIYRNNGQYKKDSGNATYGASWGTSDIVMVAVDCDNNNIYFGTNNQWADGSGNNDESSPTSAIAFTSTMISDGIVFPTFGDLSTNSPEPAGQFNFGNPPFTISSGNADADGLGNFEYAPPSGYYALCTKNINSYG